MNNQYKVLHIFSGFGGGISSLILNLIENKTDDFVFDVLAFSYKGGEEFINRIEKKGSHCYTIPRPRVEGYHAFQEYLDRLMYENMYDAIHCHIAGWMALPFAKAAKKNSVNTFVIHAHTTKYDSKLDRIPIIHRLDQFINYRVATAYMTCSDMAAEYIYGKKYLKRRQALLIPNGVKKSYFSTQISKEEIDSYNIEFRIPKDFKIVLHVGRFNEQKNHRFLVDIIAEIKKSQLEYTFLLVGDGVLMQEIVEKVDRMQLSSYVRFLHRRSDISKLMQYADCMILPSFYEGLPTVAIECQASGTPMLLADTITRQCDMQLNLVSFLPINNVELWKSELMEYIGKKRGLDESISQIESNGFTAKMAGMKYCESLKGYINQNK